MALLNLIFKVTPVSIGAVTLDATLSEQHEGGAQVTEHPVEEGADVSDHIRRDPLRLDISGMVSNTPLSFTERVNQLTAARGRAEEAFRQLEEVRDSGTLVTVATTLREYRNMAITRLSCTRDAQTGNVALMSISLREVVTVQTELAQVDPSLLAKRDLGRQATEEAPAPVAQEASGRKQSWAAWLVDRAAGR